MVIAKKKLNVKFAKDAMNAVSVVHAME